MNIVNTRVLDDFVRRHPQSKASLATWWEIAEQASWGHIHDVRDSWGSADYMEGFTVFNISGNKYRLITKIDYVRQRIYVREALTHADYSKERWKRR
jgi:mRNA interferase HigB